MSNTITPTVFYRTLNMEGLEIFYREAGPRAVHYGCNENATLRWHFEEHSSPGLRKSIRGYLLRDALPDLADLPHTGTSCKRKCRRRGGRHCRSNTECRSWLFGLALGQAPEKETSSTNRLPCVRVG